ncbi:SHOCT domain-containing protein [Fervidobacterium sp.]|uniref:SHOCT domain-containing protein n=1 Tax=Fervidobacterium sp. TaxID=1871331 RepID=UPI0025C183E4|nr:SHOCT domain-containing protein [Fervidobacterium sp.]
MMRFYGFGPWLVSGCRAGFGGWLYNTLWWLRPIMSFGLFLIAVFVIYKLFFAKSNLLRKKDNAIEILKERFVKGEISEEEYRKMRSILEEKE